MTIFIETFPVLVAFDNLDMLESLQIAKKALYGLSGIYGFVHIPTGTSYIGSSIDLGVRIMDHINNHSSNIYLQNAKGLGPKVRAFSLCLCHSGVLYSIRSAKT